MADYKANTSHVIVAVWPTAGHVVQTQHGSEARKADTNAQLQMDQTHGENPQTAHGFFISLQKVNSTPVSWVTHILGHQNPRNHFFLSQKVTLKHQLEKQAQQLSTWHSHDRWRRWIHRSGRYRRKRSLA